MRLRYKKHDTVRSINKVQEMQKCENIITAKQISCQIHECWHTKLSKRVCMKKRSKRSDIEWSFLNHRFTPQICLIPIVISLLLGELIDSRSFENSVVHAICI